MSEGKRNTTTRRARLRRIDEARMTFICLIHLTEFTNVVKNGYKRHLNYLVTLARRAK